MDELRPAYLRLCHEKPLRAGESVTLHTYPARALLIESCLCSEGATAEPPSRAPTPVYSILTPRVAAFVRVTAHRDIQRVGVVLCGKTLSLKGETAKTALDVSDDVNATFLTWLEGEAQVERLHTILREQNHPATQHPIGRIADASRDKPGILTATPEHAQASDLRAALDRVYSFVCRLYLGDHPKKEQDEAVAIVREVGPLLRDEHRSEKTVPAVVGIPPPTPPAPPAAFVPPAPEVQVHRVELPPGTYQFIIQCPDITDWDLHVDGERVASWRAHKGDWIVVHEIKKPSKVVIRWGRSIGTLRVERVT